MFKNDILFTRFYGFRNTGAQASGKIKWYPIIIGTFIFLDLPITYFILKKYQEPFLAYVVTICMTVVTLIFRLFFLKINDKVRCPEIYKRNTYQNMHNKYMFLSCNV